MSHHRVLALVRAQKETQEGLPPRISHFVSSCHLLSLERLMQQAEEVGGGAPRGCRLPKQLEPVSAQVSGGGTVATCFVATEFAS